MFFDEQDGLPEPEPKPTEPVEEVPEPKPEKKDSPLLSLLLIGAVVLAGGGIGSEVNVTYHLISSAKSTQRIAGCEAGLP